MKTKIFFMVIALFCMWYGISFGFSTYEPCRRAYPNDLQMQEYCVITQADYSEALKMYAIMMEDEEERIKFCMIMHYNGGIDFELAWRCIEMENLLDETD